MKNWIKVLSLSAVLIAASVAHAQPGVVPPAPAATVSTSTTTTTGMPAATAPIGAEYAGADSAGTMPTTGGEPILMFVGGTLTCLSALFLRRKLSAQS